MAETSPAEARSLAFTPTWSVATVLTVFVAGSLLIERLIHRLSAVRISLSLSLLAGSGTVTSAVVFLKKNIVLFDDLSFFLWNLIPKIVVECVNCRHEGSKSLILFFMVHSCEGS